MYRQLLMAGGILSVSSLLWAKGIAVRFVDIVLEKVPPGTHVNLRVYKNLPLVVINNDDEDMDVAVEVVLPDEKEMKEGYEPIPDPTWIKVIPDRYHLGPRASASSDVIITVPDDPQYLNHHYEAIIWAHSDNKNKYIPGGGVFLEVGMRSRIRMSIGIEGPVTLARERALKKLATINTNFSVNPDNLFVSNVPLGKTIDLKLEKKASFKVINQSDDPVELKFKPAPPDPNIRPQSGYEYVPDLKWIELTPKMAVPGNAIKEIKAKITIPEDPQYHGKKYMFLIQTTLSDDSLPLIYYNMLYVTLE